MIPEPGRLANGRAPPLLALLRTHVYQDAVDLCSSCIHHHRLSSKGRFVAYDMSSETQEPSYTPGALALPPPPAEGETEKITVNGNQTFRFDKLGPVVVNSDGVCTSGMIAFSAG